MDMGVGITVRAVVRWLSLVAAVVCCCVGVWGCGKKDAAGPAGLVSVIELDGAHDCSGTGEAGGPAYRIEPCEKLVVKGIGKGSFVEGANGLHISAKGDGFWRAALGDEDEVVLSKETLRPIVGSPEFGVFRDGETYSFSVCIDNLDKGWVTPTHIQYKCIGEILVGSAVKEVKAAAYEESDGEARASLIAKIKAQPEYPSIIPKVGTAEEFAAAMSEPQEPSPVASLEDFFEGNRDEGSIGCNLSEHPGIERFYEVLKEIRARDDVQDVLIEISQVEEEFDDMWPFSETVYIMTSADASEVKEWMEPLGPSEIFEGWGYGKPSAAPELKWGMVVRGAWWD
jgi:hypothetical protein